MNFGSMAQRQGAVADLVLGSELRGLIIIFQRPDRLGGGGERTALVAGDLNLDAVVATLGNAFGKSLLQLAAHVIAGAQSACDDHGHRRCNTDACFLVHLFPLMIDEKLLME